MDIPASCLFNKNKLYQFKEYLRVSGITDTNEYTIKNDIGDRGKILHKATFSRYGGDYEVVISLDNSIKEVYLPDVRYFNIDSNNFGLEIEKIYMQPTKRDGFCIYNFKNQLNVKSFYTKAVPYITITGVHIEELYIESDKRNVVELHYAPDGKRGNIESIITNGKVVVIKNSVEPRVMDLYKRMDRKSIKLMDGLTGGMFKAFCVGEGRIYGMNGGLVIGDISIDLEKVPDKVWLELQNLFDE